MRDIKKLRENIPFLTGLAVLVISIIITTAYTYNNRVYQRQSAAMNESALTEQITSQVSQQLSEYQTANDAKKAQIRANAQARKDRLISTLRKNPEEFIKQAKLASKYSSLPPSVQNELKDYIERQLDTEGEFNHIHIDLPDDNKAEEFDEIRSATDNRSYRVTFGKLTPPQPGSTIKVKSIVMGDEMVPTETQTIEVQPSASATTGTGLRTLVLVFEFANSLESERDFTLDDVKQRVFAKSDSAKEFIEKNSYFAPGVRGVTLLGDPEKDVYGWFKISSNKPTSGCNYRTFSSQAETAAKTLYPDLASKLSSYHRIMYIWPRQTACTSSVALGGIWSGLGEQPGNQTWYNGKAHVMIFSHELGHNFGLKHARAIKCSQGAVQGTCSSLEYGNYYDTMGAGGRFTSDGITNSATTAAHNNGPAKLTTAWMNSGRRLIQATPNANISLLPIENYVDSGIQVIRIPVGSTYYYVEYRTPQNYDNLWPINNFSTGVLLIHKYNSPYYDLIDSIAPWDGNFSDAALHTSGNSATDTFYDPINKIKVRLLSANGAAANVCVDFKDTGICGGSSTAPTPTGSQPTPTATSIPLPSPTPVTGSTATPIPTSSTPTTVSIMATDDSYVRSDYATSNFGTRTTLYVDGSPIAISYLKFDLSSLAGKTITDAYLRIPSYTDASAAPQNIKSVENTSWTNTGITYNNRPALGGVIGTINSGNKTISWINSSSLTSYLAGKAGGIVSIAMDSTSSDGIYFYSANTSYKPRLVITTQ